METYSSLLGFVFSPVLSLLTLNKVPLKILCFFIIPVRLKDQGREQIRHKTVIEKGRMAGKLCGGEGPGGVV